MVGNFSRLVSPGFDEVVGKVPTPKFWILSKQARSLGRIEKFRSFHFQIHIDGCVTAINKVCPWYVQKFAKYAERSQVKYVFTFQNVPLNAWLLRSWNCIYVSSNQRNIISDFLHFCLEKNKHSSQICIPTQKSTCVLCMYKRLSDFSFFHLWNF